MQGDVGACLGKRARLGGAACGRWDWCGLRLCACVVMRCAFCALGSRGYCAAVLATCFTVRVCVLLCCCVCCCVVVVRVLWCACCGVWGVGVGVAVGVVLVSVHIL
jgi:hypothetical protein